MSAITKKKQPIRLSVRAGFDSAKTTDDNRRHWANADSLAADAALSPDVRRILRNRCRYEVQNNSYARGIVCTLANDTIGTGPRPQALTDDETLNNDIEQEFSHWAAAIGLAQKLRTMRMARAQDGEAFAVIISNDKVSHDIKLDMQLIEADLVSSPPKMALKDSMVDGVELDPLGNPAKYHIAKDNPDGFGFSTGFETVPAEMMIHLFRQDRPGQHRGVPEITPGLPLFAQLRRYTLAVLSAAELAADISGIVYTDHPQEGVAAHVDALDKFEMGRNMLLTLPDGWKVEQMDSSQPTTSYAEFKKEILNEIARSLNMPFNVAIGNSSGYNYASGRLDHQTYFKSIRVDQHYIGANCLDKILVHWLREYFFLRKSRYIQTPYLPHTWFWDGMEHVDPGKEAGAAMTRMSCGISHPTGEWARMGKDFAVERVRAAADLGVTVDEYLALLRGKLFGPVPAITETKKDDEGEDEEEERDDENA